MTQKRLQQVMLVAAALALPLLLAAQTTGTASDTAPGCWPASEYTPPPAAPAAAPAEGEFGGRAPAAPVHQSDPRECLKAGMYDAGTASENMRLVATLHQPEGMQDPHPTGRSLDYLNSDLAFGKNGTLAIQGNFHGLLFYDISNPPQTKLETVVVCPGGQGDVSIWHNLAFMSVEDDGRIDCSSPPPPTRARGGAGRGRGRGAFDPNAPRPYPAPVANRVRGVRIFDITDPLRPRQVAVVQTCRGSHTHSVVVDPNDPNDIYLYVSGQAAVRSPEEMAGCDNGGPRDPHTSAYGIDVIRVPLAHPEQSRVVNHAYIFADANTGALDGLHGRQQGTGEPTRSTDGCHDVTSYPYYRLLGGACAGNGILLDITDVVHPKRLDDVADPAFSFWHSATFNNDGTRILFSDEWGGGLGARCRPQDPPNWGGDAIYDIVGTGAGRHMKFEGYYKIPQWEPDTSNCVAHNGGIIPVPGRDIMSQAFYQGGATVFDFTDPTHAHEIAYFARGPIAADHMVLGGYWSIYWYNGYLYGSELARGFDVFELQPSQYLSQNEIDAAKTAVAEGCGAPLDLNVQCQPHYTWPASYIVARAYLDQLVRDQSIQPDQASALDAAMKKVEDSSGAERRAAKADLIRLAGDLTAGAASATPSDARRMRQCAQNIQTHTAALQ